ncbi:MAG TPA: PadR family transcriptional regulator [Chloroflexi bacterium]|jgi:DNA-binding PadR family transcriptional regulator|nr:PadR family transcriptional regulator [Chloroflexota bacterium]
MRAPNVSRQMRGVMNTLLERPDTWHHGYELSCSTGLKSWTLYPILIQLVERAWLETRWADADRPSRSQRHTYRLTVEGAKAASRLARPRASRLVLRLSRDANWG